MWSRGAPLPEHRHRRIPRDGEDPGPRRVGGGQSLLLAEEREERLLRRVFRIVRPPEDPEAGAVHVHEVPFDELRGAGREARLDLLRTRFHRHLYPD